MCHTVSGPWGGGTYQGAIRRIQGVPTLPVNLARCLNLSPTISRNSNLQFSRKPSVDSATSVLNSLVAADGKRVPIVRTETYQAALKAAQGAMRKDIPAREPSRNTKPTSRS